MGLPSLGSHHRALTFPVPILCFAFSVELGKDCLLSQYLFLIAMNVSNQIYNFHLEGPIEKLAYSIS
uniref:Uncharacterized protein n=1 Tax=Lepeophtheirus salmonis TaxID=72036 RepID=A0A0K2UPB3_LEPSM